MKGNISGDAWDEFFGNPIISSFLEEAAVEPVDSDDDPAVADAPPEDNQKQSPVRKAAGTDLLAYE